MQAGHQRLALAAAVAQQLQVGCGEALTGHQRPLAGPAGVIEQADVRVQLQVSVGIGEGADECAQRDLVYREQA